MTLQLIYWILMLLWLVYGAWAGWPRGAAPANRVALGGNVLLFLLFLVLGWAQFGAPVKG